MNRALGLAVVTMSLACVALGACGDDSAARTGGGGSAPQRAHPDVILEGDATDAALDALFAAEPVKAPPQFARIDAPAEGTTLTARPTFTWAIVPQSARRAPVGDTRLAALRFSTTPASRSSSGHVLSELLALIGPERTAHAAPPAFSGTGYLLAISDAVGAPLVRVFTSKLSYTPDDAAWATLRAHTDKAISAWVLTAEFEGDTVAPAGGPFPGPWIAISVSPDAQ